MRAAIYTRVSTTGQNAEIQVQELNEYAARQGWDVLATYQDVTSGANATLTGPAHGGCSDEKVRRTPLRKLDRFGRSLFDCLDNTRNLNSWESASSR